MAIAQAVCNSFKQQILEGVHQLQSGGNVFKLSLYTSAANLSASTTVYTSTNEVGNTGQYTAGGGTLTGQQTSLDTGVAIVDFADLSFTGVTLTAAGALIYNTSAANLSASTTVYTSTNEVGNTGQYTAGGGTLTGQQTSLDTGVAIVDFADLSFTGVTLTAAGALIYNTSAANKAVCVLDFGGDKSATAGTFTIIFPAFTSASAILRIS